LAELPPGGGPREDLEAIEQAADRAAGLTRQLLAFARRTVLQPEVVSLSSIVNGLESMLRRLIGENVRLVTVTPQNRCCVLADPGQLEQVILNLAVNARDAMPDGGTLTIETADLTEPSLAGPMTTLSVTDTGIGMNAETMGHLFEPFFTTKEPGKGTGLGLSAAYGIVSASGGTIKASSDLGKGSTFRVFLPRVEGAIPRGPEPPRTTASRGVKTGTILLVEDDAGVRSFANRVLQTAGYRVLSAGDGTSAIETSRDEPVQLLLTDMLMPGMSGREVAARLVNAQPGIQVLYMSGYMDKGIVHDGTLQPGIELLAKPFTAEALLQAVDRAIARVAAE
jgi:CheY-like chemotaxis protein